MGALPQRVAEVLAGYDGPVAVMSFNPHVIAAFHKAALGIAVGLTTCAYEAGEWPMLDDASRDHLARIARFRRCPMPARVQALCFPLNT